MQKRALMIFIDMAKSKWPKQNSDEIGTYACEFS